MSIGKGLRTNEKWAKWRQGRREEGRKKGYPLRKTRNGLGCGNERRDEVG